MKCLSCQKEISIIPSKDKQFCSDKCDGIYKIFNIISESIIELYTNNILSKEDINNINTIFKNNSINLNIVNG